MALIEHDPGLGLGILKDLLSISISRRFVSRSLR